MVVLFTPTSTSKLAKTDAIDAQILAHFGEAMKPQILAISSEESRQLSDSDLPELGQLTAKQKMLIKGNLSSVSGSVTTLLFIM